MKKGIISFVVDTIEEENSFFFLKIVIKILNRNNYVFIFERFFYFSWSIYILLKMRRIVLKMTV